MFQPLALYIGLRYTRAKRKTGFVSFISLSSMIGIALGVAVLITVLSVMNGFDNEIHQRFFGMAPQVTVTAYQTGIEHWPDLQKELMKEPGIKGAAPFIGGQGLVSFNGRVFPIMLSGILPEEEGQISQLETKLIAGKLSSLKQGSFGVILGKQLAMNLGVLPGDKIRVMIPEVSVTIAGIVPRFKQFTVEGIFSAGTGFNFDSRLGFINLKDAQQLYQLGDKVTGMRVKINDIYAAPKISSDLANTLPDDYKISNWTEQFGAFFKAIKLEKTMMFLILALIIAVAAFNLVSSLVMIVNDKQSDIAILRTYGATPKTILSIFIVQGAYVGILGTFIGVIGGIILALNATSIVNILQTILHTQLISANVYFVDYLPSELLWSDVWHVTLMALVLSFLATIYPALSASRTLPAEALRYE